MYDYDPMAKKELVFYYNTAQTMYTLDYEEKWPLNDSLNYYAIIQLELFGQWSGKWDEISYVQVLMALHNKNSAKKWDDLTMQRQELASKPLPDNKTQEEKENKMIFFYALNLGTQNQQQEDFLTP